LGIQLQSDLKWEQQKLKTTRTANLTVQQILRLLPSRPRPPSSDIPSLTLPIIRQWVKGLVIPKLTYAAFIWRPSDRFCQSINSILLQPFKRILGLPMHLNHASIFQQCSTP